MLELPRNTQKHCHQSRLLYLFSDITVIVFYTNPSAHPLITSNSASSLIQLFFGMLLPPDIVSAFSLDQFKSQIQTHSSKQFSILYICKHVTFFSFSLLINCKYMVCSHRYIVVTIDGASDDVDVDDCILIKL